MKCDCNHQSNSWMQVAVYEHNIKVGNSILCTKCAYTYMLSNLIRIKAGFPGDYAEIEKAAMEYKHFEDSKKNSTVINKER